MAALAALGMAPRAALHAQTDNRTRIDTTFAFGRNGWADLSIISGDIIVHGWTQPDARVVAHIDQGSIETMFAPNRIGLTARRGSRSRNNRVGEARYELWVPVGTRVMASATSGDIRVRGTGAEVQVTTVNGALEVVDAADRIEVQTQNGDIHIARTRGRTKVFTNSGDINAEDVTGELQIKAVSSDIVLERIQATDVRIGTTNGDVSYGGTIDPKGTYEFSSHSGDIKLAIPSGSTADLSLQTFSGDISNDFPMTLMPGDLRSRQGKRWEFKIGGGGASLTVTTFSGDITIERTARARREE